MIRSVTTENPTDATAPSPIAPRICAARNAANVPDSAVPRLPVAQIRVPTMSSGLRLARSPTYAQPTEATALTRKVTASATMTVPSPTPMDSEIGLTSGPTSPMATLSSEASTTKTTTVYRRCARPPVNPTPATGAPNHARHRRSSGQARLRDQGVPPVS